MGYKEKDKWEKKRGDKTLRAAAGYKKRKRN